MVDTNIIVDVLGSAETDVASWSRRAYEYAADEGPLCCNHVILAEVAAGAARVGELLSDIHKLRIDLLDLTDASAFAAAKAFAAYRRRGGRRETILPDFLIGGHAISLSAALVTRDRRLASYFPDLTFITPETHP